MKLRYLTAPRIHDGTNWLSEGSVICVDDAGTIADIKEGTGEADLSIEFHEGIICPGFINAHCHLELSHMKGRIGQGNGLVPFLQAVMLQRNAFSEEEKQEAIKNAIKESLQNGIVAIGDIANTTDTLNYLPDSGIHIHTFVESIGFTREKAADRFNYSKKTFEAFARQSEIYKALSASIVPHAPYSVSKELFEQIDSFDPQSPLSIHNEETAAENEWYRQKSGAMFDLYATLGINTDFFEPSGATSLQTYLPWISASHPLILVHNTFLEAGDIALLQSEERQYFLCLCPNANLYIEKRLPPVDLFLAEQLPVCLGTDSLASNHQLNIWSEVLTIQKHFPDISLEILLRWATRNGAEALCLGDQLGSLRIGSRPGIINIQKDDTIQRLA